MMDDEQRGLLWKRMRDARAQSRREFDLAKAFRIAERDRRIGQHLIMRAEQRQLHLFATSATAIIILMLFLAYVFFGMTR